MFYMSVCVPSKANMPVSHNIPTLKLCLFVFQDFRKKKKNSMNTIVIFSFHVKFWMIFLDGFMRLFLQLNEHDSVIFITKN